MNKKMENFSSKHKNKLAYILVVIILILGAVLAFVCIKWRQAENQKFVPTPKVLNVYFEDNSKSGTAKELWNTKVNCYSDYLSNVIENYGSQQISGSTNSLARWNNIFSYKNFSFGILIQQFAVYTSSTSNPFSWYPIPSGCFIFVENAKKEKYNIGVSDINVKNNDTFYFVIDKINFS